MRRPLWTLLWDTTRGPLPSWAEAGLCYVGTDTALPARPYPAWPCAMCGLPAAESAHPWGVLALFHQQRNGETVWNWLAKWERCPECGRYHTARHARQRAALARAG